MPDHQRRDRSRSLRRTATDAGRKLWWHLRRRLPLDGTYFRRQVAIGPYFADFCGLMHRLVIELDGGQHGMPARMAADIIRTRYLDGSGFRVLRFWNHQVFTEIDSMIETIYAAIAADPHPLPLSTRERGDAVRSGAPCDLDQNPTCECRLSPLPCGEGQG